MPPPVITAQALGKQYRIGERGRFFRYGSLRDTLAGLARRRPPRQLETMWAVRDLTFDVEQGDVVGVIGRNGAGKSTLLKLLSRVTEPTEGDGEIAGRVGSMLEVGTGFHPELTGRENIFLNGAILGMRNREIGAKLDEIVAFAEIGRYLDTPVKHYSSGMYMRLAFAVAAHLDAEILLIDEVLAVGDIQFQKKCLGKVGELSQSGRTVLFVSHNMNAVEELCTKAMLLRDGKIVRYDTDVRRATHDYLFEADQLAKPEWVSGDGRYRNPNFSPRRLALVDAAGQSMPLPIRNDAEAFVEIEGEIESYDPALTVGYGLFAENGALMYWTTQADIPEERWAKLGPGRVRLRSRFPSRMLNEGNYRIDFLASLHFRSWILKPGADAPSILVTIRGGLSDSPYWMMARDGQLAPVIEWKRVDAAPEAE